MSAERVFLSSIVAKNGNIINEYFQKFGNTRAIIRETRFPEGSPLKKLGYDYFEHYHRLPDPLNHKPVDDLYLWGKNKFVYSLDEIKDIVKKAFHQ